MFARSQTIAQYDAELAQAILISHFDMIKAVLDHLGVPHEEGFFSKDTDVAALLKDGVYDTASAGHILRAGGPADYFTVGPEQLFKMVRPR